LQTNCGHSVRSALPQINKIKTATDAGMREAMDSRCNAMTHAGKENLVPCVAYSFYPVHP
jgi:hypothetical protein